jgi:hypothetical protein
MLNNNYSNIYSTLDFPKKPNKNEVITFTNIDNNNFTLSGSKIICNNPGRWSLYIEFQIYSYTTQTDSVKDILNTWLLVNGKNVDNSNAASSSTILSGTNTLVQAFCIELNKNDYFECGIRASSVSSDVNIGIKQLLNNTNVYAPSVIMTLNIILPDPNNIFKNYANFISNNNYPNKANTIENVILTEVDTNDFTLDGTKIICNNPGTWVFLIQAQLYCYNNSTVGSNGQIDIWATLNSERPTSNFVTSVTTQNEVTVLCSGGAAPLQKNDYLEVGILSSSLDDNINAGIVGYIAPSNVYCPSFISSAYKIDYPSVPIQFSPGQFYNNSSYIYSFLTAPSKPNNNEKVLINGSSQLDFSIDGSKIICNNPGQWFFNAQYQIVSYKNNTSNIGINAQLNGWLILNGTNLENSDASCSIEKLGESKTLLITYAINLQKGDYIECGIRSSSLDNNLNVIIQSNAGPTSGLVASLAISANKI